LLGSYALTISLSRGNSFCNETLELFDDPQEGYSWLVKIMRSKKALGYKTMYSYVGEKKRFPALEKILSKMAS
jgi:hypothetical protein